jgi:hypothetical protein
MIYDPVIRREWEKSVKVLVYWEFFAIKKYIYSNNCPSVSSLWTVHKNDTPVKKWKKNKENQMYPLLRTFCKGVPYLTGEWEAYCLSCGAPAFPAEGFQDQPSVQNPGKQHSNIDKLISWTKMVNANKFGIVDKNVWVHLYTIRGWFGGSFTLQKNTPRYQFVYIGILLVRVYKQLRFFCILPKGSQGYW